MTSYADKLPHIKLTRCQKDNNTATKQRACCQQVLDHMMRNPSAAVDIWTSIEIGLRSEVETPVTSSLTMMTILMMT